MGVDYVIFYAEANIVCIVILSLLLINDRIFSTRQENQIWFSRTIICHILYFISDIGWAAVLGGVLPRTRLLVALFNLTNFVFLAAMAYSWFMYMAASENMPFRKDRRKRILLLLPTMISLLILLIVYFVNPRFWIGENGELSNLYYPLMIAAPVLYLLISFFLSIRNARKVESSDNKRLYLLIGIYPLGIIVIGQIQLLGLNAPTFCFGITIMQLCFYILHMQTLVSVDALTRLNNRGQINRYMEQLRYKEDSHIFAMMIDVDNFKTINDTYGHAEGDRALMLVSDALKKTCGWIQSPVFLGRYGGDEFTIIIQDPAEDKQPKEIERVIHSNMAEARKEQNLPYELEVSVGYAELIDESDTMHDCLNRADKKLYMAKKSKGAGR